jgi:hypothetical protein
MITIRSTKFNTTNSAFYPQVVFMCSAVLLQYTVIVSLHIILTEANCFIFEVRTSYSLQRVQVFLCPMFPDILKMISFEVPTLRPLVLPMRVVWRWTSVEHWRNDTWRGKRKYWEGLCRSATLSATNPTWTGLGSNPALRGERPATNLSPSTALKRDFHVNCA